MDTEDSTTLDTSYRAFRPRQGILLADNQKDFLRRLSTFEAPYLEEKLRSEGLITNREEFAETFTEFKKYVALTKLTGRELGMRSTKVDNVWHQFILFTKDYMAFCNDFLGGYLHHNPETQSRPLDQRINEDTALSYREIFGEPPKGIWNFRNGINEERSSCSGCSSSCGGSSCGGGCSGGGGCSQGN